MRKGLIAATCFGLLTSASAVQAIEPERRLPAAIAYFDVGFGGAREVMQNASMNYGLKIDHDRRFGDVPPSPLFQMAFNDQGFRSAAFNGLPFAARVTQLDLAGDELTHTTFDYGLAALGLLGVGYAIYEIVDAPSETRSPEPEAPPPGEDLGPVGGLLELLEGIPGLGDVLAGLGDAPLIGDVIDVVLAIDEALLAPIVAPICNLLPIPGVCSGITASRMSHVERELRVDPEYLRWLDGGTGQMGDLFE